MAYTKHGRGAAGVGSTRRFGDFGIEQLRQRDARIIESLKLQKAQETERSQNLIAQQKDVDRSELGVEADVQQLKQDYYQNALAATKLRGRQEGQKGKDLARMIKEDAQPIIKMWQQIAGATGNVLEAGVEQAVENRIAKNTSKNYNTTVDVFDVSIWDKIGQMQLRNDLAQADRGKTVDSIWSNEFVGKSPVIIQGKALRGATLAATDQIPSILQNTLQELSLGKVLLTPETIQDSFDRRLQTIGTTLGFIDENGQWISNKHVLEFQRNWNLKVQEVTRNFSHAKVLDLNTSNSNVFFDELTDDKSAQNLFNSAFNWSLRPTDKDGLSFHSMSDGYRETLMRAAGDKNFSRRELEALGNSPWFISKEGADFGKPNKVIDKKTGKPQTIFKKFPTLKEEVLKERTTWENQWTANREAAAKEADRLDNERVVRPLLDTYKGEDLSDLIVEMESKHGKNSTTVTNLKLLQKGSIANWDSKLQLEQLEEAKRNMDHDFLIAMRNSSELTGDARKAWNEKYLPLLGPLKRVGWSSKQFKDKLEKKLKSKLDIKTTGPLKPETLDSAVLKATQDWWEKYEEYTVGPNATAAAGSADAIEKADKWLWNSIDDESGTFAVLSSADQEGLKSAEFANFLPGGVSWKDSKKYSISNQEYKQRVEDLGSEKAAALTDGVVSKEHIGYVITQLSNGKTFEPIGFTGNIKDLTRQEFYQHHVDQELKARGWKSKLVVPEDFKSSVKKDTAYDLSLKRQIEHVRTINGFWKTLTTEAEGTRPKGPEDDRINFSVKAGLMEAIENNTSTVETGRTTVNTNNTLTFESPFAADSLSYFGKQGLNMIEVQTLPNYYGDTIRAAGSAQDWLFNSGQTDWYFIPGEVPGLPGSWRYRD